MSEKTSLPVNPFQRVIWIELALDPNKAQQFNWTDYLEIFGALDPTILERALRLVASRTAVLRAQFFDSAGEPRQRIRIEVFFDVSHVDARDAPDPDSHALKWMKSRRSRCFDPAGESLLYFAIIQLPGRTILYTHFHHLVMDGLAFGSFADRLAEAYNAIAEGRPANVSDDLDLYLAHLGWNEAYRNTEEHNADVAYWGSARGERCSLSQHRSQTSERVRAAAIRLEPEAFQSVLDLGTALGMGFAQILIAAFLIYLRRTADRDRLTICMPTHGRHDAEARRLVAPLANVLPLTFGIDVHDTLDATIQGLRRQLKTALGHGRLRYEDIRKAQSLKVGDPDPFEITINALPLANKRFFAGFPVIARTFTPQHADGLTFWIFFDAARVVELKMDAEASLYETWELQSHLKNFASFLKNLGSHRATRVADIPISDEAIVRSWVNGALRTEQLASVPLQEIVKQQALRTPHAIALMCGAQDMDYATLDAHTTQFASALIERGIGAEDRVVLILDRSIALVVAVLGTLKAGGVYVPMDPAAPIERQRMILADCAPKLIIANAGATLVSAFSDCPQVTVDEVLAIAIHVKTAAVSLDSAAYCIYTSGSTGRPKGVIVEHRAVAGFVLSLAEELSLTPSDRVLQFFSQAVDSWIAEVFPALARGATVVIPESQQLLGMEEFCELLTTSKVTLAILPPAYWHSLNVTMAERHRQYPDNVHMIAVGSEKMRTNSLPTWAHVCRDGAVRLLNLYGPTETTVCTTLHWVTDADRERDIPIGRPFPNTAAFLLDDNDKLVPAGVAAEICIAGPNLARGYLNDEQLTASRFVNWHDGSDNIRLYRTGDLGRYRDDGTIEFLRRKDAQLKIRGFRVEPAEIEKAIGADASIAHSAVVACNEQLVAFVVSGANSQLDLDAVRARLHDWLPNYMIPASFVLVDSIPVTTAGKVDRIRLAQEAANHLRAPKEFIAPRTVLERAIAGSWSSALQVENVGVNDDFFDLGGDSLAAVFVLAELQGVDGVMVEPTLPMIFQARTVGDLARLLSGSSASA